MALTRETIMKKCKCNSLEEVKNLNIWGSDLEDINVVAELPNVEVISMSVNRISTLKPFSYCKNLKELYLRKNLIADLSEINHLSGNSNLRILWLEDNPISKFGNYRSFVISTLSQLTKLDNSPTLNDEKGKSSSSTDTSEKLPILPKNKRIPIHNIPYPQGKKNKIKGSIVVKEDDLMKIKDLNELSKYFSSPYMKLEDHLNSSQTENNFYKINTNKNDNTIIQTSNNHTKRKDILKAIDNLLNTVTFQELLYLKKVVDKRLKES